MISPLSQISLLSSRSVCPVPVRYISKAPQVQRVHNLLRYLPPNAQFSFPDLNECHYQPLTLQILEPLINFNECLLSASLGPWNGRLFWHTLSNRWLFPPLHSSRYLSFFTSDLTSVWSIWLLQFLSPFLFLAAADILIKVFESSPFFHWNPSRIKSMPSLPPQVLRDLALAQLFSFPYSSAPPKNLNLQQHWLTYSF